MNHLLLTQDALNISEITSIVSADSCGAVSLFVGTTRDNFEGKKVLSLEYEAYEPMALKQMGAICEELRRQWPDIVNIAIYHRLGSVPVRESSVVIAISSPHRKTSLNAVEWAIEELKKRVPIWKKEKYEDNGCSWKENKEFNAYDRHKSSFDERICDVDEPYKLSTQMVQISASENEIKRRINCFVEKKRNEIDLCNIMDYTEKKRKRSCENDANLHENGEHNDLETCARVNSIIIKQEYSKGHLKVRCVENNVGPQIRPDYLHALDKLMTFNEKTQKQKNLSVTNMEHYNSCTYQNNPLENLKYSAITERIENIEQHIKISPINVTDIYERLKIIEKRILYLESISPEYRHFLQDKCDTENPNGNFGNYKNGTVKLGVSALERKTYNADGIGAIIQDIENYNPVFDM